MKRITMMTMRRDFYTPFNESGYTGAPFTLEANFIGDDDEPTSINLTSAFDEDYHEAERYCLEHGMRHIWNNDKFSSETIPDFEDIFDAYDNE
jgi:hypothetical protein